MGDEVVPGNPVADIETDKASVAFEAQDEGFIAALLHEAGTQEIPVGTPIAVVVTDKADVAAFAKFTLADAKALAGGSRAPAAAPPAPPAPPAPVAAKAAPAPPLPPPPVKAASAPSPPPPRPVVSAAVAAAEEEAESNWRSELLKTSPLAQAMLAEQVAYEQRYGATGFEPLARKAVA